MTQISASQLGDALIVTMVTQSGSIFDSASMTGNVSRNDFGILDTTRSGSVIMVLPGPEDLQEHTYGGSEYMKFVLNLRSYVRDDGNSVSTLNKVWAVEKTIRAVLLADDTLGGSAMHAHVTHGSGWDGQTFIGTEGGLVYIPQDFTVEVDSVG